MNNNISKQYFHLTIGPVQGFIAQARRTRDFWAGSFILSWLSAVAMKTVEQEGGEVLFPQVDHNFLNWLEGTGTENIPVQGCVPSRFKAKVDADFKPEIVMAAVSMAWEALTNEIYRNDLQSVVKNGITRKIWDKQIKGFWEINWAICEKEKDTTLLDRRKNWRSHLPPDQPGLKCMVMDGWQELSGEERPNKKKLSAFWESIRGNKQPGIKSDLRKGEQLCAMAFVKRRFSRWFNKVDVPMPGGWSLKGWEVPDGVPSVAYMAAAHWLARVVQKTHADNKIKDELECFHNAAYKLTKEYGEWDTQLKCIIDSQPTKKWKALDGSVFFQSMLENPNLYDQDAAKPVLAALKALRKSVQLESASPFYAILLMDGDSLGKQMDALNNNQTIISEALAKFTKGVPGIVTQNSGFLIYAGGDDVLAILPLEDALSCAVALRTWYMKCFREQKNSKVRASISGAIEYAHIKMPLTRVLRDAHDLLDNVAKNGRGRDAIAVRVWKPGGKALEWAQPWKIALDSAGNVLLAKLAEELTLSDTDSRQYSSKFFYKIRQRFDLLNPAKPGDTPVLKPPRDVELMASEYLASGLCEHIPKEERLDYAKCVVGPLLRQCRPRIRNEANPNNVEKWKRDPNLYVDGALLVRFLAGKGVER